MTTFGRQSQLRPNAVQGPTELSEFFGLLAARFEYDRRDAPTRPPVAKPTPARPAPVQSFKHRGRLISLTAALVCLLVIALGGLPRLRPSADLPSEVLGTWRTSADGYANRGFTLTPTSLVLNAGPDGMQVSTHAITAVRANARGDETIYDIEYLEESAPSQLSLRYSAGPPSVIHLSNQRELAWSKDGAGK